MHFRNCRAARAIRSNGANVSAASSSEEGEYFKALASDHRPQRRARQYDQQRRIENLRQPERVWLTARFRESLRRAMVDLRPTAWTRCTTSTPLRATGASLSGRSMVPTLSFVKASLEVCLGIFLPLQHAEGKSRRHFSEVGFWPDTAAPSSRLSRKWMSRPSMPSSTCLAVTTL